MNPLPDYIDADLRDIFRSPEQRIQQNEWELRRFLSRVLDELKPERTLELGTWRGTTAALLSLVTSGLTSSIDIEDYGGRAAAQAIALKNRRQLEFWLLDARSPQTVEMVRADFGKPIDLLFIDDGHRIEEVTAEYELWKPLVRPGGWIAFHDINPDANQCAPGEHPAICQSHAHWAGLSGDKEEIIFRGPPPGPGIGILKV